MLHCNMNLVWQHSYALQLFQPRRVVKLDGGGGGCSARTKSREAGTAKCANKAARSAHCSMNTSRSGFSQSTCTACEMQPGSWRERRTCSRLHLLTSLKESSRAVTLPVTTTSV